MVISVDREHTPKIVSMSFWRIVGIGQTFVAERIVGEQIRINLPLEMESGAVGPSRPLFDVDAKVGDIIALVRRRVRDYIGVPQEWTSWEWVCHAQNE